MQLRPVIARALVLIVALSLALPSVALADPGDDETSGVAKNGITLDLRSHGRQVADEVAQNGLLASLDEVSPDPGVDVVPQVQLRGGNVQVNDGSLDNIQIFAGLRPFVKFTQSETSVAAFGRNIVAVYNSSANQPVTRNAAGELVFTRRFLSAFSTSNDGGQTWMSAFMPPVPGSIFTFGDPVVAVDRDGIFYFAGLGADALGRSTVQVNKSVDGGRTWSDAVVVQQDNGGDKEWLAVGRDPFNELQTNVYVTWTSFVTPTRAELRFARSTDGGATWTTKVIFAPAANADPAKPQDSLQASNPYVDPITGTLYVPFARFSNSDVDFLQVMVSSDAGQTFGFLNFNVPGAPDRTLLPVVQAGELIDCGRRSGGFRLTIHSGANVGGGRFGLRRFVNATRLVTQPAFAARNGILYLAWSNSTSTVFGDPNGLSNVLFIRSDDGGATWTAPLQVNPAVSTDTHHVLPSLAIDRDPIDVHVSYYTQHADGSVDLDLANSHDRGATFPSDRTVRVPSTSFQLPPSNIPIPTAVNPFLTTNYDRTIRACYALGEYQSVAYANGTVYVLWGDGRNTVTEPAGAPITGTHAQTDVFFQIVKAQ